ncbi:MAG TPA: hypothetical protein DHV22_11530 [Xanthomarina gelatinilytica]|uniref:Uncharacterized protein n=1 Tax=Xanthomarina gelatinilytica TaxID=1137281 RepID=A0A3D6BSF2_9FLAO|nr:hypothetical protein [Xanthomarina gelatinilytica]
MKHIFTLILMVLTTTVFAQDPMLQKPDRSLPEEVKSLSLAYNNELALNTDQLKVFEIKLEEFLIRREKIENTLEGRDKLEALYLLQDQETEEMKDILTRNQMQVYTRVKPSIQPITTVDKKR